MMIFINIILIKFYYFQNEELNNRNYNFKKYMIFKYIPNLY